MIQNLCLENRPHPLLRPLLSRLWIGVLFFELHEAGVSSLPLGIATPAGGHLAVVCGDRLVRGNKLALDRAVGSGRTGANDAGRRRGSYPDQGHRAANDSGAILPDAELLSLLRGILSRNSPTAKQSRHTSRAPRETEVPC